MDILDELRNYEIPDMPQSNYRNLRTLLETAADEIEKLRSLCGKANVSEGFRDLTKDVSRCSVEPAYPKDGPCD